MTFSINETYMPRKIKITMPPKTATLIATGSTQSQISFFIIFLDLVNWAKLWFLYTCYQFFTENSFQQLFIIKMSGQIMLRTYRPYLIYGIPYTVYRIWYQRISFLFARFFINLFLAFTSWIPTSKYEICLWTRYLYRPWYKINEKFTSSTSQTVKCRIFRTV